MRKQINLSKKFLKYDQIFYDDNYISNGKFIVHRAVIIDSFKYCNPKITPNDKLKDFFEKDYPKEFFKTNELIDHARTDDFTSNKLSRKFLSADNISAYINEDFVKLFCLESLYGSENDKPFISTDKLILVMAMRKPVSE